MNVLFHFILSLFVYSTYLLVASIFSFEPCKFYFPTPSPCPSWSQSDVCLYAFPGRTVPTSQMHPVCWNRPLIEYDQKKIFFQMSDIFFFSMNNYFHNISRYLGIFWDIYLRKYLLFTKYVCGRIETFSMSGQRLSFHQNLV